MVLAIRLEVVATTAMGKVTTADTVRGMRDTEMILLPRTVKGIRCKSRRPTTPTDRSSEADTVREAASIQVSAPADMDLAKDRYCQIRTIMDTEMDNRISILALVMAATVRSMDSVVLETLISLQDHPIAVFDVRSNVISEQSPLPHSLSRRCRNRSVR